ncbi:MAG: response regulator [Bermanella sp.]
MTSKSGELNSKVEVLRNAFLERQKDTENELTQLITQLSPNKNKVENNSFLERLIFLLHKLKGTSGTFGFSALSALAKNMEKQTLVLLNDEEQLSQYDIESLSQFLKLIFDENNVSDKSQATVDPLWRVPQTLQAPQSDTSRKIILVDSDVELVRLLEIQLNHFGFELVSLDDHRHLEKAVKFAKPAAVVMDVVFSGEDDAGVNLVKELRDRGVLTCPLFFISIRDDLQARLSAIRAGCDGYLSKPINISNLVEVISNLLQRNSSENYRVLIVDDDIEEAKMNALLCNENGIETMIVTNPLEAMARIRELNPDVILMDIKMPGCSGFELASVIRQHLQYTQIPIIFLMASDMEDDWLRAMQSGGDEYLTKNISHKELVSSILARATRSRQLSNMIKKLSMSETRFRSVSASARDAMITSDSQNRIVTWNTGAQRQFGYMEAEIQGNDLACLFTESEVQYFQGDFEFIEMQGIHKNGQTFPVEVSKAIWQVDNAFFSTFIIRDMAKRKQYEKSINDARQLAEKANLAKSNFLAAMSHELRTPLHAILGFGQMLIRNAQEPLSKLQNKCVSHITNSGQHLLGLIDDVLDLAKIESGKVDLLFEDVAIQRLLDECIELAQPIAERYKVSIESQGEHSNELLIYADSGRTKQVILNLLSNAAKYNQEGGKINIRCEVLMDGNLRICVEDSGIGIAEDKWPDLFKPFSRLGAETSEIEGTGIGLSVTKNLVEMMNGKIGFSSVQGQGSCFWVDMPMPLHLEKEVKPNEPIEVIAESPFKELPEISGTLLYIEDNPTNLTLMTMLIQKIKGLNFISAATAEEGIALVKKQRPDIVIMDLNLPGMNGFEALEVLKQPDTCGIPIVALSADARDNNIEKGLNAGFKAYLTKPIDIYEVADVIKDILKNN